MSAVVLHKGQPLPVTSPRIAVADEGRTRWMFLALCAYLVSQAYTIPVVLVGPWAVWPRLGDFALGLLVAAWLVERRHATPTTQGQRAVFHAFALLFAL